MTGFKEIENIEENVWIAYLHSDVLPWLYWYIQQFTESFIENIRVTELVFPWLD